MTKRALLTSILAAQFLAVVAMPGIAINRTAPAFVNANATATHQTRTLTLADDPLPCPDCISTT